MKLADVYLAADEKEKALEVLASILNIIKGNESAYSQSKNTLVVAEKYYQLGRTKEATQLAAQALEIIQPVQETEDKINSYAGIAKILVKLNQKEKALEIAKQVFDLSLKIEDKKSRIYWLGEIALLYAQLADVEKADMVISEILIILSESTVKTQGLGTLAIELAEAGECVLAFRLVRAIHDAHIKSSAIANIAKSLVASGQEPTAELKRLVSEARL
jgi:tetratricopeptide (TPR) repeat protein